MDKREKKHSHTGVILTGAGSGIGLSLCRRLLEGGFTVYGIWHLTPLPHRFSEKEGGVGLHSPRTNENKLIPVEMDLRSDAELIQNEIKRIKKEAEEQGFPIRILINNAGAAYYGLHEEISPRKIDEMVRVNLEAPMILTQMMLRDFKKAGMEQIRPHVRQSAVGSGSGAKAAGPYEDRIVSNAAGPCEDRIVSNAAGPCEDRIVSNAAGSYEDRIVSNAAEPDENSIPPDDSVSDGDSMPPTIINIVSETAEEYSNPHGACYGALKAGLLSFSRSIFAESRKCGVRVSSILPGMTDTALYRNADFEPDPSKGAHLEADDVADAVMYILGQPAGVAVPELMITPQFRRISRKTNCGERQK